MRTVKKHWWGKTTHKRLFTNFGWVYQVNFYLLGIKNFHFLTENHKLSNDRDF